MWTRNVHRGCTVLYILESVTEKFFFQMEILQSTADLASVLVCYSMPLADSCLNLCIDNLRWQFVGYPLHLNLYDSLAQVCFGRMSLAIGWWRRTGPSCCCLGDDALLKHELNENKTDDDNNTAHWCINGCCMPQASSWSCAGREKQKGNKTR